MSNAKDILYNFGVGRGGTNMMNKRKKLDEYIVDAERRLNDEIEAAEIEKQKQMEVKKREQIEIKKTEVAEFLEELELQKIVMEGMMGEVHIEETSDSKKKLDVTEEQARRQAEAKEIRERAKKAKARTRRLIQEGAILESIFPELREMELEAVKGALTEMKEKLKERSV